jgi:hypothetical protein
MSAEKNAAQNKSDNGRVRNLANTPVPNWAQFALLQQIIVMVLAGLMLDGGALAQICFYALVAYWGSAMTIVVRRQAPTRIDVLWLKWSYIPLCCASFYLSQWIWRLRGC